MKSKLRNYLVTIFTNILFLNMLKTTNSGIVPNCEKNYFDCNGKKCSQNGHCYFKMSNNSSETEIKAECICASGFVDTPPNPNDLSPEKENKVKCCY